MRHGMYCRIAAAYLLLSLVVAAPASASITLPDPVPPDNSLIYGDFVVYSLGFLNNIATGNPRSPHGPYYKSSVLGDIADDVIIGVSNPQAGPAGNLPVMDDAYQTPSGAGSGGGEYDAASDRYFSTGIDPHPPVAGGQAFLSDTTSTWNAQVGSLAAQLGLGDPGNELVFFFGLNQTDSRDTQTIDTGQGQNQTSLPISATDIDNITRPVQAQDMLIWVRMLITDTLGNLIPNSEFILHGGDENPLGPDVLDPVDNLGLADGQWVHVHGEIVVDATTGEFKRYGSDADPNANEKVVAQNLGNKQAAFAVFNQDLSDLVKSLAITNPDYVFKMDLRYAFNTNGPETIWAQTTAIEGEITVVPEASSVGIWAILGMVGVGFSRYRRRRAG